MEKGVQWTRGAFRTSFRVTFLQAISLSIFLALSWLMIDVSLKYPRFYPLVLSSQYSLAVSRCCALGLVPGPPPNFGNRDQSDRFVPGTKPTLLKNAKIWTGSENGSEVIHGDILLDRGLIKTVGQLNNSSFAAYSDLVVIDVQNSYVTPGLVDIHSHLGDASSPELAGASSDDNSMKGPILPWLRALDGLNTHDDSYALSIAGGVTTSLILPGSANAIGGQGFTIKLRKTAERTPTSMLLEPPHQINTSLLDSSMSLRWRHMKHACGENPDGVYSFSRMDTMWAFREAYDKARQIKLSQDTYCSKVLSGEDMTDSEFPHDLQWEALVDVLRGRVKLHVHCYEAVDLDGLVRLSNEFKFPIAAVHHASEAYLVPALLKQSYDHPPAVALFATNARYKREAYRTSEFAPRILNDHGFQVAMKSDHPVMNSRYLLYEAQQAFYYGLETVKALSAVTTTPAEVLGLGWRIGYVKEGWDADLVVWDSHPLSLGATPTQVFIDGILQLESPHVVRKSQTFQSTPKVPNFDKEAEDAVEYDGLPPLEIDIPQKNVILFTNVRSAIVRSGGDINTLFNSEGGELGVVLVQNGTILCLGLQSSCGSSLVSDAEIHIVDLQGGEISPGLVSFGSPLGLSAIEAEGSTNDGPVYDPFAKHVPEILGAGGAMIKAVDGLEFATRDALLAYRSGVTSAITAPTHFGFYGGLGTHFSLGAEHKLAKGALLQEVAGLHVTVRHFGKKPSVSTQVAVLRRLLLGDGEWWKETAQGMVPLVIEAHSADIIATLLLLKKEIEEKRGSHLKLTITGASEAHLLAKELGEAGVGVILNPVRPFPYRWEDRRILPGPPLSSESAITKLFKHNVTVGIGIEEIWSARNTRFDIGWASLEAGGLLTKEQALALGSTNVEKLLGVIVDIANEREWHGDLVATARGGLMDLESKVVGVVSPKREIVDLF